MAWERAQVWHVNILENKCKACWCSNNMKITFWYPFMSFLKQDIIRNKSHLHKSSKHHNYNIVIMQDSFHSCFPFPNFFVHVILFCNEFWTIFQVHLDKTMQNFGIIIGILTCLWHSMAKMKPYKWAWRLKLWTKNNIS
jgi:hypothetical protein